MIMMLRQTVRAAAPVGPSRFGRPLTRVLIGILIGGAAACSALTDVPASLANVSDTLTIYALNGAPYGAPVALDIFSGALLPADANFYFDVAFDLSAADEVLILPQRAVASSLVTTHSVALATVADTFEAVTGVPDNVSFRADTAMTVVPNQVVLVRTDASASACAGATIGSVLYAKLVIRGVNLEARTMNIEYVVNPNCGFKSFASGVPTFVRSAPETQFPLNPTTRAP